VNGTDQQWEVKDASGKFEFLGPMKDAGKAGHHYHDRHYHESWIIIIMIISIIIIIIMNHHYHDDHHHHYYDHDHHHYQVKRVRWGPLCQGRLRSCWWLKAKWLSKETPSVPSVLWRWRWLFVCWLSFVPLAGLHFCIGLDFVTPLVVIFFKQTSSSSLSGESHCSFRWEGSILECLS
jgi:hypothetical protein